MVGDALKAVYLRATRAPPQFLVCAGVQIVTDLFVLYQMFFLYAKNPPVRAMLTRFVYVACFAPTPPRRDDENV